ncbi:hypothetical protein [Streptomyces cucumeris]|uniref:hypothetical protein n=1 Tax=Streptomyces cucumeris TaxID=2962890 RepID=UPI0020C86A01|nr:hypothetical protein [Streptomyces sp. NEAU-Y11]MCP9213454.1 hypothetical protein [Streptomyces sp. NEAU-Y11]
MKIARRLLVGATAVALGILGMSAVPSQGAEMPKAGVHSAASVQAPTGKWKVHTTFFAKDGSDVPLRQGTGTWGYKHIQEDHPQPDSSLYGWIDETLKNGTPKPDHNDPSKRVVRWRLAKGVMFRVVFSEREYSDSHDGRPRGIITAFKE